MMISKGFYLLVPLYLQLFILHREIALEVGRRWSMGVYLYVLCVSCNNPHQILSLPCCGVTPLTAKVQSMQFHVCSCTRESEANDNGRRGE